MEKLKFFAYCMDDRACRALDVLHASGEECGIAGGYPDFKDDLRDGYGLVALFSGSDAWPKRHAYLLEKDSKHSDLIPEWTKDCQYLIALRTTSALSRSFVLGTLAVPRIVQKHIALSPRLCV